MHVARRLFSGERAAVLAGVVWACSPPLLWMPKRSSLGDVALGACLLMGLVALGLEWGFAAEQVDMAGEHWASTAA